MDVLVAIREKYAELPVIVMTGMGYDDDLINEVGAKGADGYMSKTLPLDQLLFEIHRVLRDRPSASALDRLFQVTRSSPE